MRNPLSRRTLGALAASIFAVTSVLVVFTSASAEGQFEFTATQTIAVPPASTYQGSGGGDGWDVSFNENQVFNVFHHQGSFTVACHSQINAAECWPAKTIVGPEGENFATGSHSGTWTSVDRKRLYGMGVRSTDSTAGVVCVDLTKANAAENPFCGFIELSTVGGGRQVSAPMLVNGKAYAFNYVNGAASVVSNNGLLCFDTVSNAACAGQPYLVNFGTGLMQTESWPAPSVGAIGDRVFIPAADNNGVNSLACFDTAKLANCAGFPATLPVSVATSGGPFAMLDPQVGQPSGVCLPTATLQCLDFQGKPVQAPNALATTMTANLGWNGPGVTVSGRTYAVNGSDNTVRCYDFISSASCSGFPKVLNNVGLPYSLTRDPQRPTCLWVNGDWGSGQIQNFDAFTGGACGAGPVRVLANQFVVDDEPGCAPSLYKSLRVLEPQRSFYKTGTVKFLDTAGNPVAGTAPLNIDASGSVDLKPLGKMDGKGLPQFLIELESDAGRPGSVTVELKWTGSQQMLCIKGDAISQPDIEAKTCKPVEMIAISGSGEDWVTETDLQNSKILNEFHKGLEKRSGTAVGINRLPYRAQKVDVLFNSVVDNNWASFNPVSIISRLKSNTRFFLSSAQDGTALLTDKVNAVEKSCPTSAIVIAGYSQGALVAHTWTQNNSVRAHPRVRSIVLFADPGQHGNSHARVFGSSSGSGLCTQPTARFFDRSGGILDRCKDISPQWGDRVLAVCNDKDPVCDSSRALPSLVDEGMAAFWRKGGPAGLAAFARAANAAATVHKDSYNGPVNAKAAAWAANKVRR